MDTLAALRRAWADFLEAARPDLAELVRHASIEIIGPGEQWFVGSQRVQADTIALAVPPDVAARLQTDGAARSALRDGAAAVMKTPTTALNDLAIVVELPAIKASWAHAYRSAPRRETEERPAPEAVLAGAAALARAREDTNAASILDRSSLEVAPIPSSGRGLLRYVVRLTPADLAWVETRYELAESIRSALTHAGTRALESVAEVELRLRIDPEATPANEG